MFFHRWEEFRALRTGVTHEPPETEAALKKSKMTNRDLTNCSDQNVLNGVISAGGFFFVNPNDCDLLSNSILPDR